MIRREVQVNLDEGLHLRPLSMIADVARRAECDIRIYRDEKSIDARNMLELMTMNAVHGTPLVLEARGVGAEEVVAVLEQLFERNFADDHAARE